jgi:putative hydrolase of the HAD superfamily
MVAATYYAGRDVHLRAYDEVEHSLATLAARGFTLIAATNGNADLAPHPFMARVDHHQQAELVGVSKHDPAFFARAVADAGGQPELSLSVGDRIDNDVLSARAASLHATLLDRHDQARAVEVPRITSLTELLTLVELPV